MKLIKSLIILFTTQFLIGQDTQDFLPLSLQLDNNFVRESFVLPTVDVDELKAEDERLSHLKRLRFGYEHELNQDFFEAANEFTFEDNRVFLLQLFSYDAYALRAIFEPFYLPEGVNLFIYNNDMSQLEGAYTNNNNNDASFFSTPLIEGERIVIELNVPRGIDLSDIELEISTNIQYIFL